MHAWARIDETGNEAGGNGWNAECSRALITFYDKGYQSEEDTDVERKSRRRRQRVETKLGITTTQLSLAAQALVTDPKRQQTYLEPNSSTLNKKQQLEAGEVLERKVEDNQDEDEEGLVVVSAEDILGITTFGTTKNTHVDDNSKTAARGGRAPRQIRKARQYMNKKIKKKDPTAAAAVIPTLQFQ